VKEVSWEKLKQDADILSIHVPLTSETRGFFTIEELESFRKPFWFANTARGEVISFKTLNQVLDKGILKGAVRIRRYHNEHNEHNEDDKDRECKDSERAGREL
jgi:D-3-phosphoglycerate dehydrogenase